MTALVVSLTDLGPEQAAGDTGAVHTTESLRSVTERIHHYRGIVLTSTTGRLLAVFGADRSNDDDPERAVRVALDLLDARHAARAGVATGEAVVTATPDGPDQVLGDAVHLALTLEQAAAPATVLVSGATHQATGRVFSYALVEPAGGLERSSGMRLWRAVEPRARTGAQVGGRPSAPLVERERELAFLDDVLGRFLRDRLPQSVTLVSDPGLGKSRLVAELSRMVDGTPELVGWRVGHARAYGQGPLGALVEVVEAEAGVLDGDDAGTTRRRLDEVVTGLFGPGAGSITESLGVLLGTADTGQLSGQREALFDDWARFLAAVAEQRPLVLVLEDLQWADTALVEFASGLPGRVGPVPLLLVVTARPELLESPVGWGGGQPNAVTLTLSPLSCDGTSKLLDALLADVAAENPGLAKELSNEETRTALRDAAGGNPLYIEEYVHMLAGQDAGAAPAGQPLSVPTSVQQVIAARIDTLPPDDKRLLRDAAVVGESGWVGALATVSRRERDDVAGGLRRLEWRDLLRRVRVSSVAGETEYAFRHTLIREVAYGQLLREERAGKHQRAAAWIESLGSEAGERLELLAHHYGRALKLARAAGRPTKALTRHVRRVSRTAGDRATRFGSFTAAASAYRAALALCAADDPERPELLLKLGQTMVFGEYAGGDVLQQAREAALARRRRDLATEADVLLSLLARTRRDWAAEERTRQRLSGSAGQPVRDTDLKALGELAIGLVMVDRNADGLTLARQLVGRARHVGRSDLEGNALCLAGQARMLLGDLDGGLGDYQQGHRLIDAHQTPYRFLARYAVARALWWYGDVRRCAEVVATGRQIAETADPAMSAWFQGMRVALGYATGDWDAAVACADLAAAEPPPGPRTMAECLLYCGAINLARGRPDAALADARAARESINPNDARYRQATLALEGRALLAAGQRTDATARLEDLLTDQREHPAQSGATPDEVALLLDLDYPPDALPEGLAPTRWNQAVRALVERDFKRAVELLETIGSKPDAAAARVRLESAS